MKRKLRNRYFFFSDIVLLPIAVYLSYVLRLEAFDPSSRWWPGMVALAVCLTVFTALLFRWAGVYSRFWRYASINELLLLSGAFAVSVMVATASAGIIGALLGAHWRIPRSIPFILFLLGLALIATPRLLIRIWWRRTARAGQGQREAKPVLIMGAGDTGAAMIQEIQHNPQLGLKVVGFLDDDAGKHNVVIHGAPVLGGREAIRRLASEYDVRQVIIAMPTASGKEIRAVVRLCEQAKVQARTVPGMLELLDGRVSVSQVREVRIEDLLRREPIRTDMAAVSGLLEGKRVLITGGGGSIGGELARQVQQCRPAQLMLLGHGENSIFAIYHELLDKLCQNTARGEAEARLLPVIADIRSAEQMQAILQDFQPDIVFHAAAHKHVPLMEMNPCEAVLNNVGDAQLAGGGGEGGHRALRDGVDGQGRQPVQRHGRDQARGGAGGATKRAGAAGAPM